MAYKLLSSAATVLIYSPTLITDALICSIASSPSGSVLIRTIPEVSFQSDQGAGLLESLSSAVEGILGGGTAIDATGTQGVDNSGLLYDAVLFTIEYLPPLPSPGSITSTVEIPVNVITADTQFGSFLTDPTTGAPLGSAADRISAAYQKLAALAGG